MKYVKEFENTSAKNQYLDEAPTGYYVLRDNSLSENRVDILYHSAQVWKGLTFTAVEPNSTVRYATINTSQYGYYSTDGIDWIEADEVTITLENIGDKVFFKGGKTPIPSTQQAYFAMTGKIAASGSIMSMQNENPDDTIIYAGIFSHMFAGCTSLVTAPELPATTLSIECYKQMFQGCTNLNYIKCLATNISDFNCTFDWLYNVSPTGTFVTPASTNWTTGSSGIPTGWTRVDA